MAIRVIIDCDPGVDDAIALLLAFASPELEILAITTVAGNVPLRLTQSNARKICELAGRQIPVYAGCPRPLVRSLETAEYVHGATGLQGATLPDPQLPLQPQHAVDYLIATLMQTDERITIATLGPLTNLAVAIVKEPRIVEKIDRLVLMGGAAGAGNVTASAEFNIYVDPHAAHVVFTSGIALTMIGLDVTHQVLTTADRLAAIRAIGTPISEAAAGMLKFYGEYDRQQFGMSDSPLHDPCVIAYLIQPDLFTVKALPVEIELVSPQSIGRTIVGYSISEPKNLVDVAQSANSDAFYDLLTTRLATLSAS
ncbi:nucleoside hydrolase [Microcoleus sp. FACHB-1515]|uniref:nucleoside hydrolase n=1 Tax=Cyanophyceae TaxID=3028117 RepID=UPI0016864A08|nr:nucleoside hydrolase [Microcoleus sp. FACHB-1515]MBD2088852.1 nucleoside hydrolase [Microcoleus sp. FACHB-1515]